MVKTVILRSALTLAMVLQFSSVRAASAPNSGSKYLKYIPQNYSIDTVRKSYYPVALVLPGDYTCSNQDLLKKVVTCNQCSNIWGDSHCPDCCLVDPGANNLVLKCTPAADPQYSCSATPPFSLSSCNQECQSCAMDKNCSNNTPPNSSLCQKICCRNDLTEDPSYGCEKDQSSGPGIWLCTKKLNDTQTRNCKQQSSDPADCYNYPNPYQFKKTIYGSGKCPGNASKCYKYAVSDQFKKCVANCRDKADRWDSCSRNIYCCKSNRCPDKFETTCNDQDCSARLSPKNKDCNSIYTPQNCNDWYQEYNKYTLAGSGAGELQSCFMEIDPANTYAFVARGNEDVIITWQILINVNNKNIDEKFLSMVKIFEADNMNVPIHESIVHQKAFSADFFINSATAIPRSLLKTGHSYAVKLFYYFPATGLDLAAKKTVTLNINVEEVQMIIIRNRN